MRKTLLLLVLFWTSLVAYPRPVRTGIEVLRADNFRLLEGKRIGLITNPTGIDSRFNSTIDLLHQAPNVQLVALFGPEHGVRGDVYAGDKIDNRSDTRTLLPVYSLYGATRKPTPEMLRGIDALVYDIQDNGCRSFTYISTMGLAMEAAAEAGIEFIVLDRPNPLGGEKIEGNLAEAPFRSFVSQFAIPYIYGLSCGELATLINNEKMIAQSCRLTVVKMKGWKRSMNWEATGLPWVVASPHLPHKHSSYFYPATGILGELGYVSIGVGYTLPFEMAGAPWIDADSLSNALNKLGLAGVHFRPVHFKPFYGTFKGEQCEGVQLHITDYKSVRLTELQFYIMQEISRLYPSNAIFDNANPSRFEMFDKVCGSNQIRKLFSVSHRAADMLDYFRKDERSFRTLAKRYYLYK
ncbi:MAG: DUF1343 domain-containing protein [Bacteroidales bacterium]|nr:DUF1343 domain-containing protein [Bacteroidales bacterium]OJX88499.1 MAG: hypothetical protein BGP01_09140 [Paludibacter sp. 47-17]